MRLSLVGLTASVAVTSLACVASPPPEGDADSGPSTVPSLVTPAVSKLALETGWGCVLYRDRTLSCWGQDPFAALGMRAATESWTDASWVEGVPALIDIAAFEDRLCAIEADSAAVLCWDRMVRTPERIAVEGTVELAAGAGEICARDGKGTVRCWRTGSVANEITHSAITVALGSLSQPPDLTSHGAAAEMFEPVAGFGASVVAASSTYSCAAEQEEIRCWGTRSSDDADARPVERHVMALDASSLVVDGDFSCVTSDARVLTCWGQRDVDRGDIVAAAPRPIARGVDPLVKLEGPCALEFDGDLRCDLLQPFSRPPPRVHGVTDFALGYEGLCVLVGARLECFDGESWDPWPSTPGLRRPVAVEFTDLVLCAIHDRGAVGCMFAWERRPQPVPGLHRVVALTRDQCALDDRGQVACWGYVTLDDDSLLLTDPQALSLLPAAVEAVTTDDQACVRTEDGRVACVSRHPGAYVNRVPTVEWLDVANAVELAAGRQHVCVRDGEGDITCVGDNRRGQLGAQPPPLVLTPTAIRDCSKHACE